MSTYTALTERSALPVNIGGTVIYCESFRISAARVMKEESTADGGTVLTNSAFRSSRLAFTGRVCITDGPEDIILGYNALVRPASGFGINYMGLSFSDCRMLSYTLEDKGGEWADVTVTVMTAEPVIREVTP